jgi:hypothetical protein
MPPLGLALQKHKITHPFIVLLVFLLVACSPSEKHSTPLDVRVNVKADTKRFEGVWITESRHTAMPDPQTSGLVAWRGKLLSISDRSAIPKQRMTIHIIDPETGQLQTPGFPVSLSDTLKQSCFADYVGGNPDLEALLVDPRDDRVFYTVTEDASMTSLSPACQQRYTGTGSTDYPTVLVRLELQDDNRVLMTHARPVRFAPEFGVGDFPNDGIEGITIDEQRQLYLALEKDNQGNARIFQVTMGDDFWESENFADVRDSKLRLPHFEKGNHPINGIQYVASLGGKRALVAAARNDDQLWIVYLDRSTPTDVINMTFWAPTKHEQNASGDQCELMELMDNSSIEGVAVLNNQLWLVNDPWKRNYAKNIQCESNRSRYESMSPLLFSVSLESL